MSFGFSGKTSVLKILRTVNLHRCRTGWTIIGGKAFMVSGFIRQTAIDVAWGTHKGTFYDAGERVFWNTLVSSDKLFRNHRHTCREKSKQSENEFHR